MNTNPFDVDLALKLASYTHQVTKNCPHDIGIHLAQIVADHQLMKPTITDAHRALAAKINDPESYTSDGVPVEDIAQWLAEHDAKAQRQLDTRLDALVALLAACEEVDTVLVHAKVMPHVRQKLLAVMQQVKAGQLLDEVKALREDKARLDWLNKLRGSHDWNECQHVWNNFEHLDLRQAIDAARKAQP
jgi:hypothetical protein